MELAVIEEVPPRALAVVPDQQAGTFALASMSDDEFTTRLASLKRGRDRIAQIQRELMDKDVDYGIIPGTPKPTLLKPGAEKLCDWYGLRADFAPERVIGDGLTAPTLAYQTRCELHLGSLDGPIVAVGYGSANSWERKHRYRRAERACPECGMIGALNRSKRDPEFYCWTKKGGCGKTFKLNDPRIIDQPLGDVENPDPWDLDTTLLKMAEKRAHVDATLRATAASGLFTQDVEDQPRPIVDETPPPQEPPLDERIAARRQEVRPAFNPATDPDTQAIARGVAGDASPSEKAAGRAALDRINGEAAAAAEPTIIDSKPAQCDARSPFDAEVQCRKEAGHAGVHRTPTESWPQS